jgi:murein DD-endopeptidase MepM/ murein hydrolase activator NlpD
MRCRGILSLPIVAAAVVACSPPPPAVRSPGRDIALLPDTETIEALVPRGGTLAQVLREHRLPEELVTAAVEATAPLFDLRRLRAGNPYRLVRTLDGVLREFEYRIDTDRFLRIVGLERSSQPAVAVHVIPYQKKSRRLALAGSIDEDRPSLIAAIDSSGERVELALALADIFGGEVDFTSDVHPGDSFELLFDRFTLEDDEFAGYGPILAATFKSGDRTLKAYRFVGQDGKAGYYDPEGRSMRRLFLRSPLKFEPRVTSRFSRSRLHPVLRTYRAHLGVDYGAPAGSPVVAVASGVVVSAGFNGQAGRMVTIRHAGGYESSYLHLSSISVKRGARLDQGQIVGRVGSSGLATGAHLDYRLKRNGVFVNPLTEHQRLPPGEPIPAGSIAAFEAQRDSAVEQLASAPRSGVVVTASASAPAPAQGAGAVW